MAVVDAAFACAEGVQHKMRQGGGDEGVGVRQSVLRVAASRHLACIPAPGARVAIRLDHPAPGARVAIRLDHPARRGG